MSVFSKLGTFSAFIYNTFIPCYTLFSSHGIIPAHTELTVRIMSKSSRARSKIFTRVTQSSLKWVCGSFPILQDHRGNVHARY